VRYVIKYFDDATEEKIEKFISTLQDSTKAKILYGYELLMQYGSRVGMPHSKNLGGGLYELRIRGKEEIRIFYAIKNNVIILSAFKKKTKKTPNREIETANKLLHRI
jgi:phage-related protein